MVRPMVRRLRGLCALLAVAALLPAEPAWGYEFWTRARTTGEAYELRGFRLVGGELAIGRRRLTHTLTLVLHDLGDLARKRRRAGRWLRGPVVSWHGTLRFDHDFGTFITGRLDAGPTMRQDALDLIPELEDSAFALSLLYGHLRIDGLWNDRLRLALGRIAPLSADGALPFDGAELRMQVTDHVEVVVSGGLAVREASWLGVAAYELDGTPGASCHEYVEAAQGQPGRWRLIERGERVVDGRFSSDFELCPQRQVRMPTASLSLVTQEISGVSAQLGYRVAMSRTVGSLGPPDRLHEPDLGLYPDEHGQAPAWGTNLEQVLATAHGRWRLGEFTVAPLVLLRASLAHGVVDRAELSAELTRGAHSLSPQVARLVPTFDTDSIWNVFGAAPSLELSLTYRHDGAWQARALSWARRYDGGASGGAAWAAGASSELARPLAQVGGRPLHAAVGALADAGYGGQRMACDGELRLGAPRSQVAARGALVWARGDAAASAAGDGERATVAGTASARATLALSAGVTVHSLLELRRAGSGETSLRALGVLELSLEPNR
ncbi:MAG: hypothetical protein IPI49_04055 [Myxococcales bacterium]|nr:hypothetical protein [Myxococcales bacterium]